ncbi:MAG: Glu/Leu/Phe/Val family dehydrogenase [Commensalibacter sp.]|nr:Glu/Leu/Phe/Val dehydrogenase [Commensalibacter sp.]
MFDIYRGPVFDMARKQFSQAADVLEIPQDQRDRLLYPKRAVAVTCPIHRDDGSTVVFEGYRVQHHLTLGPTKGGVRFAKTVDIGEVAALSLWMSWKCSLMNLPYGGAKGGIRVDPYTLSPRELEALSRRYMQELIPFVGPHTDVMAPDIGTNEQVMAWFMDTYSNDAGCTVTEIVTGKPVSCGGTQGRREATGKGVTHLISRAAEEIKLNLNGATAVIQGFGNVGSVVATELHERGTKVLAISDHTAAYHDPKGLDIPAIIKYVEKHGVLKGYSSEILTDPKKILTIKCDIAVPAAIERTVDEHIAKELQCKILAEAANGPTTIEADAVLAARPDKIFIIPDILCNSGGVTVSYFEWVQDLQQFFWEEEEIINRLKKLMDKAFYRVIALAKERGISNRLAATCCGLERVHQAKKARGLFP